MLGSIKSGNTYTPAAGIRLDRGYEYDLMGSVVKERDRTPASAASQGPGSIERVFGHDPLRRLLSATGRESTVALSQPSWDLNVRPQDYTATNTYTRSYSYDRLGNIQTLRHVANGIPANNFTRRYNYQNGFGSNMLETMGIGTNTYPYTYDANGNQTKENSDRYFEWNYADKLSFFKRQAGSGSPSLWVHYFYDASGQRIKKVVNKPGGIQEMTVYVDGVFEHSYVRINDNVDNNRNYNTLHVLDASRRIATLRVGKDSQDSTPELKYYVEDHLGNSSVAVQSNGNRINLEEYYPFGETSFGSVAKKRYRYNGKEKDEHTGLYEYGQRYYAPWLCRFISVDPIAEKFPQLSSYNYASNRPETARDLEGLQASDQTPELQNNNTKKKPESNSIENSGSKMPNNKNIHNAPEKTDFEGKQGTDFDIATYGEAQTAFSDSNKNKGQIRSSNKDYTVEVFWNPNTKTSTGKGAYVWQRSKVEPRLDMVKIPTRGVATKLIGRIEIVTPYTPKPETTIPSENDKPKVEPFIVGQTTVLNIGNYADGTLILDKDGNSPDLDAVIERIIATGNQVGSITLNSQIGIGLGLNELQFSTNLFNNVSNYIRQQLPNIQINIGWIGPASGAQRVSPTHPASIIFQSPRASDTQGN